MNPVDINVSTIGTEISSNERLSSTPEQEQFQKKTNEPEAGGVDLANNLGLNSENKETTSSSDLFEEIRTNLEKINNFIPIQSTSLVFEFDELGEPPVVKVLDKNSQEIIREIPPKEFRDMAKALEEIADKLTGKGILFNDSV